jgi:hypothetical protein
LDIVDVISAVVQIVDLLGQIGGNAIVGALVGADESNVTTFVGDGNITAGFPLVDTVLDIKTIARIAEHDAGKCHNKKKQYTFHI